MGANHRRTLYLILCLIIMNDCSGQKENLTLKEVNEHFTFKGKPINPKVIHALLPWISDHSPTVMSIDVASANESNQFFADSITKDQNGYIRANTEYGGYVDYKWLGKLNNDIHVVRAWSNGGGIDSFQDLLFVRFSIQTFKDEGVPYEQLLMTLADEYSLGNNHTYPKILIDSANNKVTIDNPGFSKKKIEVKF